MLSRLLYGGRVSLMVGLIAVAVSCPLGVVVGLAWRASSAAGSTAC